MKKRTLLSWSSGKDSAWALQLLSQQPDIELVGLFSTINAAAQRVAMHAVRNELLQQQARQIGLPLQLIPLPFPCGNAEYEAIMTRFIAEIRQQHIDCVAFGDLFLEDIRQYREDRLAGTGIEPLFPLWGLPTGQLARDMISAGLRARVTCVDPKLLPPELAGRDYDEAFLAELSAGIDPCGENGEFHTFVYDGPMFRAPVAIRPGEVVQRDGFVFADLLPAAP